MLYLRPFENSITSRDMFDDFFSKPVNSLMPKTDVKETENEYIVESEIPGVKKEDIKINYSDDTLVFEVKSEENKEVKDGEKFIRRERRTQSFRRAFTVTDIDRENIEASYNDGVLKIVLPKDKKALESKNTSIEVK